MKKPTVKTVVIIVLVALLGIAYVLNSRRQGLESVTDIPGQVITESPTTQNTNTAEQPASPQSETKAPTITFQGVQGRPTSGNGSIVTTTEGTFIRLEDNFETSAAAPDMRVYLGNANGHTLEIAKLKAPKGGQNFLLPANVNIADYSHVWIHCKAFNITYGKGEIVRS